MANPLFGNNPYGTLGPSPVRAARIDRLRRKAKPKRTAPTDPYWGVKAQVDEILSNLLSQVQREQDAAKAQAERDAQLELDRGNAYAQGLKALNISGALQQVFQSAGQASAGLAQGFSGAIRDQASADAAQQARMLSGTGQEGAVRNQGEAMGNVSYGLHGSIPGNESNSIGAAFGAQAALQPGFAAQLGQLAAAERRREFADELTRFGEQRAEILAKRPELLRDLLEQQRELEADERDFQLARARHNLNVAKFNRPAAEKPYNLQAKPYGDGRYIAWDPRTGKTIGEPFGTKKPPGKTGGEKPYNLQLKSVGNRQAWFDPRTGKRVSEWMAVPASTSTAKPKTPPRLDEAGRLTDRTDGVTATQARAYKNTAYLTAKQWHANGGQVNLGTEDAPNIVEMKPLDVLKLMVNDGGVPFDIAVRQLARFHPAAREWLKTRFNPLTGQTTPKTTRPQNASTRPVEPEAGAIVTPASFKATHTTANLGWPAVDLMGRPGTPVASPVSGTIVRHGSAQGGEALYLEADDGTMYWLGHIDRMAPVGTRVARGETIAYISADHARPHVHLARQSGSRL